MTRLGVGVAVTAAALAAVIWVAQDNNRAAGSLPTAAEVCAVAGEVAESLDLTSLRDQAGLPARAAELAQLLAHSDLAPGDPETASAIVVALADDTATVDDLVAVLAPVVQRCGVSADGS